MQNQAASAFNEIKKTGMCSTSNAGVIFSSAKPKMDGGGEPFQTATTTTPPMKSEMCGKPNDNPAQFSPLYTPGATNFDIDDISDGSEDCDMKNVQRDAEFNRWLDKEIDDTAEALRGQFADTVPAKLACRGGNTKQRHQSYKKRFSFKRALKYSRSRIKKLKQQKGSNSSSFNQEGVREDPETGGNYYERVRNENNGKYMKLDKRIK